MRGALLLVAAGCGRIGFGAALDPDADLDGAMDPDAPDGAPACASLFCDGFEDPALAVWSAAANAGATANRDAAFGFRGASLHAVSPNGSDLAVRYVDVFPTVAPTNEWVRLYIYIASGMTLDLEPMELTNAGGDFKLVFGLFDTDLDIHAHDFAGDFLTPGAGAPPRDQWVCYEFHVEIGASGTVELYREGTLIVAQPAIDTRPPDGDLSRLRVGIASKPTNRTEGVFIDEVAAGTTRPGCL